jgi:hypothetical protein
MFFYFAQDVIEFTASDVALHLLPTMHPRGKLSALFERELLDSSLDLGQTHFDILVPETTCRNAREVSIVSSDPLLFFRTSQILIHPSDLR